MLWNNEKLFEREREREWELRSRKLSTRARTLLESHGGSRILDTFLRKLPSESSDY